MLSNLMRLAWRNMQRQKLFTIINLVGLTLGLLTSLLILLFVQAEHSYDAFHEKKDRLYRVQFVQLTRPREGVVASPTLSERERFDVQTHLTMPQGQLLKDEVPGTVRMSRYSPEERTLVVRGQPFTQKVQYVDPDFVQMFTCVTLMGSTTDALQLGAVAITEKIAEKHFGTAAEALGQTLLIAEGAAEALFTVKAIVANPSPYSAFQFEVLANIEQTARYARHKDNWGAWGFYTYIELSPGTNPLQYASIATTVTEKAMGEKRATRWRTEANLKATDPILKMELMPVADMHLDYLSDADGGSNPLYSFILLGVAWLIVAVACINFTLLALTRVMNRSTEVGLRKMMGAARLQIFGQYFAETLLFTLFALVLACIGIELLLPTFSDMVNRQLVLYSHTWLQVVGIGSGICVLMALLAGAYPAWVMTRMQSFTLIRSRTSQKASPRGVQVLVVAQYAIAVFLIIAAVVMNSQMRYLASKPLGYQPEQVVVLPLHNKLPAQNSGNGGKRIIDNMRSAISGRVGVVQVAGASISFSRGYSSWGFKSEDKEYQAYTFTVTPEYIETMGLKLLQGRNFTHDSSEAKHSLIINEAFARKYGWDQPIGRVCNLFEARQDPPRVIGVVADYHFQSLSKEIEPMILMVNEEMEPISYAQVRLAAGQVPQGMELLRSVWATVQPNKPFEPAFLSADVAKQYEAYQRWTNIINAAMAMAVVIAMLGMFGLAGMQAANRVREIGVRKVLGASVSQIWLLLNKDLLKWVAIAFVLALPLAHYAASKWLAGFAFHIEPSVWLYGSAALLVLLIAVGSVSYQSLRAANANPVDALRSE